MRTEEFHKLLEDPKNVADYLVDDLRALAMKYPYSQVIQLMYGLKLRSSSEHLFNQQLGKTAVLSNDRSVLFELFENKAPQVNTGLEIVEVDQSVPEIKPEVPASEPEILETEPSSGTESIKESPAAEEVSKAERESLPTSSAAEIPSEQAKEETLAAPVEAKRPSEPLPSGLPENMEGLSPQERVKAILERNRQLRAQFEAAKSTGEEKLFEEAKAEATKEETPSDEPVIEEGEISSQSPETEKTEAQDAQPQKSEETASTDDPELPTAKSEELEEPNLVPPIEELSPETDNSKEQEPDTESSEEEASPEPWADTPIDIEALIRRRFARRYEADTADDNDSEEDEMDPWSDEEWVAEESTTAEDPSVEAIEATELETEPEAAEEPELQATELSDDHLESEPEPQSDLAMAARIRIITDRLDTLQEEGDFSQEELQSLMDEHRRLEEALTSDLPADEKQLFEVDAKDSDSDLATSEETAKELVEVQGEVVIPEPKEDEEASQDDHPPIKETPAPEQKQSEISPSPEVKSQVEEEEARDENDVDAEIRRIEALAARLRNGPNREMSQTEINQLREKRMEEMISDRKKSLEASKNVEKPQKDAVEDGLSADATQASNQETNEATSPQVDSDSAASEQVENPSPNKPLEVKSTETEELKEGEPQEDLSAEKNENKAVDESKTEASQDLATEASTQEDPQEDGQVEPAEELVPEASYATEDTAEEEQSGTSLAATEPESEPDESEEEAINSDEESESTNLSFSDWLKRISNQKVETSSSAKEASPEREEEVEEPRAEIAEKIDLLDSFVEKLPELKKQSRASGTVSKPKSSSLESADSEGAGGLVTETLAKVYIRQKHYKKAIQAYEILMLKYPEKSSFFASQILEIKKLENSK